VDAPDLHLLLDPKIDSKGVFSGGNKAVIDQTKCISCGECKKVCRFDAIKLEQFYGQSFHRIDTIACEGCGACALICKENAIMLKKVNNGHWYVSQTRFGPLSHAKLEPAEENSGKLVTLVKNNMQQMNGKNNQFSIIDGAPGTGCPVIASLTGADYTVIITEPTVSGIHDLKRILQVANFFNIKSGVIVNKYDLSQKNTDEIINITYEYKSEYLGNIPYDNAFLESQILGLSFVEYVDNEVSKQISRIWEKVTKIVINQKGG